MKPSFAAMILLTMLALAGCNSEKLETQKSPCAGLEGSPCGPKRAVNAELL